LLLSSASFNLFSTLKNYDLFTSFDYLYASKSFYISPTFAVSRSIWLVLYSVSFLNKFSLFVIFASKSVISFWVCNNRSSFNLTFLVANFYASVIFFISFWSISIDRFNFYYWTIIALILFSISWFFEPRDLFFSKSSLILFLFADEFSVN